MLRLQIGGIWLYDVSRIPAMVTALDNVRALWKAMQVSHQLLLSILDGRDWPAQAHQDSLLSLLAR